MNILLVDDEEDWRRTTAVLILQLGHAVFEATDADGAAAILSRTPIDVLITDIRLQGKSGDILASEARAQQPGIRLVFVTGDGTFPDPEADPHGPFLLKKPVDPADLETALNRAR